MQPFCAKKQPGSVFALFVQTPDVSRFRRDSAPISRPAGGKPGKDALRRTLLQVKHRLTLDSEFLSPYNDG